MGLGFRVATLPDIDSFLNRYRVDLVPLTVHLSPTGQVRSARLDVLSDEDIANLVAIRTEAS